MEKKILHKILNEAMRAPSGDNLQNWKIKSMDKNKGFLLRIGPHHEDFFDVEGLASQFSCGCFLKNAEIVASKYGYGTKIKVFSNSNKLNVAQVIFFNKKGEFGLYREIDKRVTCRTSYVKQDLPSEFYQDIKKLDIKFRKLNNVFIKRNNSIFKKIVEILYRAEIVRIFNKFSTASTSKTIRYSPKEIYETKTGLDYRLLGVPIFQKQMVKMAFNKKFLKILKSAKINIPPYVSGKRPLKNSAGIGCIFIKDTSRKSVIEAGMFFQELWLIITRHGGCLQPFATLPFFNLKIEHGEILEFSEDELKRLKNMKSKFFSILKIQKKKRLIMVYRYGFAKKNPKILSLRKNLNEVLLNEEY